jgi:hypothetical protein
MLRGESHLALKQQVLATGDYKSVITRRGAAMLTGTHHCGLLFRTHVSSARRGARGL